jgi:hypothetical protein
VIFEDKFSSFYTVSKSFAIKMSNSGKVILVLGEQEYRKLLAAESMLTMLLSEVQHVIKNVQVRQVIQEEEEIKKDE